MAQVLLLSGAEVKMSPKMAEFLSLADANCTPTQRRRAMRARREGADAQRRGVAFHDNPYRQANTPASDTGLYSSWEFGWSNSDEFTDSPAGNFNDLVKAAEQLPGASVIGAYRERISGVHPAGPLDDEELLRLFIELRNTRAALDSMGLGWALAVNALTMELMTVNQILSARGIGYFSF